MLGKGFRPPSTLSMVDAANDTAAEYDCADEAMDGCDVGDADDMILSLNRDRVGLMKIQKPKIRSNKGQDPALIRPEDRTVRHVKSKISADM